MSLAIQVIVVVAGFAAVLAIVLYATWLLAHRLRKCESKRLAFGEWVRNVFEGLWGL